MRKWNEIERKNFEVVGDNRIGMEKKRLNPYEVFREFLFLSW
jgi:hypothetical protein